jgi:hypothetical protein
MGYTLGEAARATGLNKSSILKAIRAGKISGTKDEHGQWDIQPCELHRVYPARSEDNGAGNGADNYRHPPDIALTEANARASVAEQRLSDLKAMLDRAHQECHRWRDEASAWRDHAQRLALPKPVPERQLQSWWAWLRSTG